MKTKIGIIISALILACLISPLQAWSMDLLSDEQMDNITAGSDNVLDEISDLLTRIPFNYIGNNSEALGDIVIYTPTTNNFQQTNQTGIMNLQDNAQSNLRSLVNINAVNSPVNVQLNITILQKNATIENLFQSNKAFAWLRGI